MPECSYVFHLYSVWVTLNTKIKKENGPVFLVILQLSQYNLRGTNLNVYCDALSMTAEEVGGDSDCEPQKSRKSVCITPLRSFKSGSTTSAAVFGIEINRLRVQTDTYMQKREIY